MASIQRQFWKLCRSVEPDKKKNKLVSLQKYYLHFWFFYLLFVSTVQSVWRHKKKKCYLSVENSLLPSMVPEWHDKRDRLHVFVFLEKWKVGPMTESRSWHEAFFSTFPLLSSSAYTHWAFAMAQGSGTYAHCPHGTSRLVLKVKMTLGFMGSLERR